MEGFGRLLRAEWTKLWSVRRWLLGMAAAVLLTLLFSLVTAAGSSTDLNQRPEDFTIGPDGELVRDELHLVHQPLTGDGSLTVRVAAQDESHPSARAGVMLRERLAPGSRYAAVLVTPGDGIRFQANYTIDRAGGAGAAPRWLRLTRTGTTVAGYESADGAAWQQVGSVDLAGLPATVPVGFFVNSPDQIEYERFFGGSSSGERPTPGRAEFDQVRLAPAPPAAAWERTDTSRGFVRTGGAFRQDGERFTVEGSGDLVLDPPDTDHAQMSLFGVVLGQLAVAVVAVLFITSEYKRGMIRTSFAASPRRGRVLAAKAIVIGVATFLVGLVATVTAFLVSQPVLRDSGFAPPAYPAVSLADGPVLRAVVGGAVLLGLVAVFSLGLGTVLRRGAGAIAAVVAVLMVPVIIEGGLPLAVAQWLIRSTPTAGLAILQTQPVDPARRIVAPDMADPLPGLAVVALYAAASLAIAYWRLRRRDA